MPRAFLITHRRYNGNEEFEENVRDFSPERGVRIPEYNSNQPTSDGVSDCGSESSSECPDELYNLTKLAEVSLAAAAGTLIHPNNIYQRSISPTVWSSSYHNESSSTNKINNSKNNNNNNNNNTNELSLRERTRLFFERIETEKDILESRNRKTCLISPKLNEIINIKSSNNNDNNYLNNKNELLINDNCILSTKIDDNEEHECPDCGKKYSTSSNLARHRQTHRSLGDKKARRCPHCDKVYVSMPAFSMHVRTHNQGCKCHYCGKCFSRPWLLQGHIRTHTGEKPFKCTICNKAFADKSNLRAHVQTHSNTKPHVCGRCGKAFALKSYLYKHEESSCMRAHNRSTTDKKDDNIINLTSAITPVTTTSSSSSSSSSPSLGFSSTGPTSSPTSVIVTRPGVIESTPITFSSIIQHTKSTKQVSINSPLSKKRYWNDDDNDDDLNSKKISNVLTKIPIIRNTVISTNPDHKSGRNNIDNNNLNSNFDFTDPSRPSAFSRPSSMSLAIA